MQVCRRLDGLPLAIELAAARLRALSLSQLAARLDDQFWLLTGGSRAQVPRQRTLEATVAWSYDLLSEVEQRVFARLAVFPDHFTLDMAEAVVSEPPVSELDVVDIVARLVDKSLVTTVNAPDGLRYQLLEMLRQYGHDRLIECGEADRFRERLFACAMSGVEQLELVMRTPAMDDALQKAAINAVTYRAAMRWAASHKQEGAALRIAAMVPLSHHRGERRAEILERLSKAHTAGQTIRQRATPGRLSPMPPSSRATGRHRCRRAPGRSSTSRPQGSRLTAWAQLRRGSACGAALRSRRLIGEVIGNFRRSTTTWAWVSLWLASLRSVDLDTAKDMAAEADELLRRVEVPMGVAHNVEGRGIIAFERGELDEAANFLTEAIQAFASYGNAGCTAHALEASAVVIGAASHNGGSLALELFAAATQFRHQSGQGHRPWEIRARLGDLQDRIVTPNATAAHVPESRYTLSVASTLAAQALQSLATPHAS